MRIPRNLRTRLPSNHGQCVAEVARDPEAVGDNDTHGWAVSFAARVTCWEEFAEPDNAETEEDAEDSEGADDEDSSEASEDEAGSEKQRGKSAEAHERKQDRGHGKPSWAGLNAHGHGHGKGGPHH